VGQSGLLATSEGASTPQQGNKKGVVVEGLAFMMMMMMMMMIWLWLWLWLWLWRWWWMRRRRVT